MVSRKITIQLWGIIPVWWFPYAYGDFVRMGNNIYIYTYICLYQPIGGRKRLEVGYNIAYFYDTVWGMGVIQNNNRYINRYRILIFWPVM